MPKDRIFLEVLSTEGSELSDFMFELHKFKLSEKYRIGMIPDPSLRFRRDFIEEIVKSGLHSFLSFGMAMDAITSPSMHVDEVFDVFHMFTKALHPAEKLLVIDPYFYPKEEDVDKVALTFSGLLEPISATLKKLTVVSEHRQGSIPIMNRKIQSLIPSIASIENYKCNDIHDRFWINPESKKGMVVGTSLNSIGKKLSLVDHLSKRDLDEVLRIVQDQGVII